MPQDYREDGQVDLFLPQLTALPLRDQRETMERPFFSLSKRKRLKPIDYISPDRKITVHVSANSEYGLATIYDLRSEEHTSELQSLMRHSYAVFCLKKTTNTHTRKNVQTTTKII